MPKVKTSRLTMNYEQQGAGEPLVLIPYLTADNACYAFQVAEYAKHFTCISMDLRGAGETEATPGAYSTADLADDVAAFMQALGIRKAHVAGLSLGGGIGLWLAAKYPGMVASLSVHSAWHKSDGFVKAVLASWQTAAKALGNVPEMVIGTLLPWCFTPELYAAKPEYIESLAAFVRSRPAMTVESFLQQSNAVIGHDAEAVLSKITAPTLITFGRHDQVTSTRFAEPLRRIRNSELVIFEGASHAPIYEVVEEFNGKTLEFLKRHSAAASATASV